MLKLDNRFGRPDKKYWPELLRDCVEKHRAGGTDKEDAVRDAIWDLESLWGICIDSPRDLL